MYNYNKIKKRIGSNLYEIRKSRGQTQEQFASELNNKLKSAYNLDGNYDFKTISNWEQGKSIPKLDVLIAISKEYNLSLDELLKEKIDDVISHSSFSASDENILDEFLDNKYVCVKSNNQYVSSFNPKMYKYGQLSYLADNLVEYRSSFSKNFKVTNPIKDVQIIVGIMDVNDGKRELHYLGNGENDIVSVENIPANYSFWEIENNNVIDSLFCSQLKNDNMDIVVKLGNGKTYTLRGDDRYSDYDKEQFKFKEGEIPQDLDFYGLTKDDDWLSYATLKGHYIIDDNLFDFFGSGAWYYKNAGVFEVVLFGKIKCTDAQLIKILSDDYKHRLIQLLSEISDESIFEELKKEVLDYEIKRAEEILYIKKQLSNKEINKEKTND